MVGSAAVRTDNEEQTFVGLGAEAVGGPCLEAITAGGSTQAGKKTAKEGVGEGNKDLQIKVVDTFKKNKKKKHYLQKINEDTEQLDVRYTVYISMYQRMNGNKNQRKISTIKNFEPKNSNMTFAD